RSYPVSLRARSRREHQEERGRWTRDARARDGGAAEAASLRRGGSPLRRSDRSTVPERASYPGGIPPQARRAGHEHSPETAAARRHVPATLLLEERDE